ncbi:MAG: heme-binding domain-containing protein [Bacteroidota bacterium]
MLKKILLGLLAVLVILQFIRPEKNNSKDNTYHISTAYEVPAEVEDLLAVACNDCHTNETRYPWYSNVQPVGWWLDHHVEEGKEHLNFSAFTNRRIAVQNHKLEELIEEVEEHKMPMDEYTYLGMHPEADLSDAQRQVLMDWAKSQMDMLKAKYPADSLVLRRRKQQASH